MTLVIKTTTTLDRAAGKIGGAVSEVAVPKRRQARSLPASFD
jgi:hypothetical protein